MNTLLTMTAQEIINQNVNEALKLGSYFLPMLVYILALFCLVKLIKLLNNVV